MLLHNFVFIVLFAASISFFVYNLLRIRSYLRLGRKDNRSQNHFARIKNLLTVGLAQSKILREPFAGLMHAFIFWGFIVLSTAILESLIQGFYSDFSYASLGGISKYIFASQDIFCLLVIISVLFAVFRRLVLKPKRLKGDNTKSYDALVILFLIFLVMVTMMGVNSAKLLIHSGSDVHYKGHILAAFVSQLYNTSDVIIAYSVFWWGHVILVFVFLNYLPYSKHFHVVTSLPNVYLAKLGPQTLDTEEIDFEKEDVFLGTGDIEQLTWKEMLDGYACTECGRCSSVCPANITGKPLSPRKIIMNIRERVGQKAPLIVKRKEIPPDIETQKLVSDVYISDAELWACTSCMACMHECPVSIEHINPIVDMRRYLVQSESRFPEELMTVFSNMENNGAPWAFPQSDRLIWAEGLNVPLAYEKKEFEVLYWVGCAGAFDARYQNVSRALAELLNKAGVNYAVLGTEEKCNGDSARRLGNEYLAQMLIKENIVTLKKYKFSKILVSCPHCFHIIGNEYKAFGGDFEVIHHSDFIGELIEEGKIKLLESKKTDNTITYHDSCYLGRYNKIYDSPRKLLRKVNRSNLTEMERSGDKGLCCGAGGGRMWLEEKIGKKVNILRTEEALTLNPDIISTACPFCMTMMTDGVKEKGRDDKVKVKDLAELVNESSE
jgi:Fe-S oxidoreductase